MGASSRTRLPRQVVVASIIIIKAPRLPAFCSLPGLEQGRHELPVSAITRGEEKIMAKVDFEDLSGTATPITSNPFDGLINACHGDPVRTTILLPVTVISDMSIRN
jgi:hypothetical protein